MKTIKKVKPNVKLLAAMERALKTANLPIIFTDAGQKRRGPRIVFVNKAFCKSTRYNEKELLGQSPRILQGPRTDPALLTRLAEQLENGMSFSGQTINYRKNGTPYCATWNICPICDDKGKVTHHISFQTHSAAPKL